MIRSALVCIAMGVFAGVPAATAGPLPMLAAHRAVYDLTLARAETKAGLTDVRGKLVLEVAGSPCDGWTANMRVVNRLAPRTGTASTLDTRSTSWESGEGDMMEFATQRFINGTQEMELRGRAERNAEGGKVTIEEPEPGSFTLPKGVIFPVQHTRRILNAAMQGSKRDASAIFDGNEDQEVLTAVTFIGKRNKPNSVVLPISLKGGQDLNKMASWPVSIGYFENKPKEDPDGEQMPEHQVSFTMFENSVAANLTLDYGDFALKGSLVELDYLQQAKCGMQ
ncbi:hypothetical protein FHS85_002854 [Rhodoligotrophos appendicifer]|uniref:EipB family protein n=1 Tax=Rhodoligotrophos appendicifer TaxID=987056 RepID=UPI00118646E1|nr:DUF1849 family protein [Rhodoligotrophos appendicifer]